MRIGRSELTRLWPAFLSLVLLGCGSSSSNSSNPTAPDGGADGGGAADASLAGTPPAAPASCPNVVSAANCDPNSRPIVFVHGTYSSGTDIEHMAALFGSNGYCQERFTAIDYDSVAASASVASGGVDSPGVDCTAPNTPPGCGMIDQAVDALLAKYPQFQTVDLMGHSQGTFHCGNYLAKHANKIAHYINFSGVPSVGATQTLSLSSLRDLNIPGAPPPHHATGDSICAFQELADGGLDPVVPDGGAPEAGTGTTTDDAGEADGGAPPSGTADGGAGCNVTQITLIQQDHFAVAASKDSFTRVYKYLNGKDPMYTDIQCGDDPVTVEGVAETFADNVPQSGKLEIWEVGGTPRSMSAPVMTVMGDTTGHFGLNGTIQLKRGAQYVFVGYDANNKLIGWQYNTPFKRDNHLMRLLAPPSASDGSPVGALVAGQTFAHVVSSSSTSVVVARWAQGGFRQDLGASLKINGNEVLSSDNSGLNAASNASLQGGVAALFMEDANKNKKSDLGLPYYTTFIAFTDVFVDATKPAFLDMTFTAGSEDPETVNVPLTAENYPSPQGLVEVIFQ